MNGFLHSFIQRLWCSSILLIVEYLLGTCMRVNCILQDQTATNYTVVAALHTLGAIHWSPQILAWSSCQKKKVGKREAREGQEARLQAKGSGTGGPFQKPRYYILWSTKKRRETSWVASSSKSRFHCKHVDRVAFLKQGIPFLPIGTTVS